MITAKEIVNELVDQIANAPITIDCRDRAEESMINQVVELARRIQNNRNKR